MENKDILSASEAIYGLLGWLTSRDKTVTFSAKHNASIAAELADEFCTANNLTFPRDDFHTNLIHPASDDTERLDSFAEVCHGLVDIIYENKELRAQLASCVEALTESDKYLANGKLNQIGFGSILHRMIKDAIDSLPATAKPLSTKKMGMVWDLIKDVEDEGGSQ